jgi:beta-aspartyl-peptidase (threonine type)
VVMTDASVMRGSDLALGAVGAVTGIRHPIDLARAVLEDGKHALLVGPGALAFARARGIERCDPRALETDRSKAKWWSGQSGVSDTVGAVAMDAQGEVVAGTSTGGLLGKYEGRVGDSPIAGAGNYARAGWGGISATGHGETMMRTVLAFHALFALSQPGRGAPGEVLRAMLDDATARIGGRGGMIAILGDGTPAWARNTKHMGAAWVSEGSEVVSVF